MQAMRGGASHEEDTQGAAFMDDDMQMLEDAMLTLGVRNSQRLLHRQDLSKLTMNSIEMFCQQAVKSRMQEERETQRLLCDVATLRKRKRSESARTLLERVAARLR